MRFFHAFAVTMFVLSVTTLLTFTLRDRSITHDTSSFESAKASHKAATRLLCSGAAISLLEAFSGWMSCKALAEMNISVFGPGRGSVEMIVLITLIAGTAGTIATRHLHDDLAACAGLISEK